MIFCVLLNTDDVRVLFFLVCSPTLNVILMTHGQKKSPFYNLRTRIRASCARLPGQTWSNLSPVAGGVTSYCRAGTGNPHHTLKRLIPGGQELPGSFLYGEVETHDAS